MTGPDQKPYPRVRSGHDCLPVADSFTPNTIDAAGIVVQLLNAL